jgi:hypothetical protein
LKLLSFKKIKIKFIRNMHIFNFLYLLKNINKKTSHLLRQLYAFIITICKKIVQKLICMKKIFLGQKEM